MSAEAFRDLQQESGSFERIRNSAYEPYQLLGSAITAFDEAEDAVERGELYQPLLVSLAAYARSTQTWQQMPSLTEVPGIHFAVTDWLGADDRLVMRPMLFISEKIPLIEDFIIGMSVHLAMHLRRCPNATPKEWPGFESSL